MAASPCYESLVEPYLQDLQQYCFYLTKSAWDGEDLYQESLLKSLVYFARAGEIKDTKPFLFRVARNLWIDEHRARKRRLQYSLMAREAHYDRSYLEIRALVEWLSERLPERNLEIWLLAKYFGYSMQEIADQCQTTVPAVKSVLSRTKGMLRLAQPRTVGPKRNGVIDWRMERWVRCILQERPHMLGLPG